MKRKQIKYLTRQIKILQKWLFKLSRLRYVVKLSINKKLNTDILVERTNLLQELRDGSLVEGFISLKLMQEELDELLGRN